MTDQTPTCLLHLQGTIACTAARSTKSDQLSKVSRGIGRDWFACRAICNPGDRHAPADLFQRHGAQQAALACAVSHCPFMTCASEGSYDYII